MTTQQTMNEHEMLSALADGQLRGAAFAQAVELVQHDEEAQATWHRYHLIGDVLRAGDLAASSGDSAFLARLQTRLSQEPGFAQPAPGLATPLPQPEPVAVVAAASAEAANAPSFRWKMVAGFASMAAVAAIGWNLVGVPGALPAGSPQVALVSVPAGSPVQPVGANPASAAPVSSSVAQPVTLASGEPQVMLRDRRLDELMAAHKQFGGTSALQMPAGFLRNATFEAPAR